MTSANVRLASLAVAGIAVLCLAAFSQQVSLDFAEGMRWRCIGPFRAGRTVGAAGIPSQPNVFYIGVNNGGVWKTTDFGRTWKPIFDEQPTGSIGDLAIAPSNSDIIYVGSGEGLQRPDLSVGDGIYKTTDGGRTWRHLGLSDGQQIGSIVVDPRDPNRVFVAVLGHPYGANQERGVYRSLDGGITWQKVLYKDENTGAIQVAFDPKDAQVIYADLWAARQGPWENGAWQGPGSGLFKSSDGGNTWRQLTKGLPTFEQGLGRIGIGISLSNPSIIFATVDASQQLGGVYRSDDAGESWRPVSGDGRLWGRGSDFAEIQVHPKNPETVFVANICSYRSIDGGKTFTAFKGAPGGDDYHRIWINPQTPEIMLFATDQGATITVNGGESWSSWYNQPTAQFYHVSTDNQFPYWVYGGQQESGSAAVASRSDYGAITWRDWRTVGVEEYGYVAPDPLDSNIIYGGKLTRFDKTTGQTQNIAPEALRSGKYRFLRTAPVLFSPVDPRTLYLAGNVLFKTTNGGKAWEVISPDLSREEPEIPSSIGVYRSAELDRMPRRGVIYTVAPSFQVSSTIWAGTDDGLIHLTRDGGKTWSNVTPAQLTSWSKVSLLVASQFDNESAYAAVNRFRLDDLRPHIYRTRDGGKTWKEIVNGIPVNEVVNAVREDHVRRGLLFAGTERAVYFSIDDGEHWQSLRRNMPATSIRDLVVHQDDVVVGTHGRSFWILDDITPLRQIDTQTFSAAAHLFQPQISYRMRRSLNTDTPIPPEEPMGQNPPDGAIIDYYLKSDATEVSLDILDSQRSVIRHFSSNEKPEPINEQEFAIPTYWMRTPQVLSAKAGMRRFVWDLHHAPPAVLRREFPISAIYRDTPRHPLGPSVLPGEYTVRLTADGRISSQLLTVRMDPRVKTAAAELAAQYKISIGLTELLQMDFDALQEVRRVRSQLKELQSRSGQGALANSLTEIERKAASLEGGTERSGAAGGGGGERTLARLNGELASLLAVIEGADVAPTTQAVAAWDELQRATSALMMRWSDIKSKDVPQLNDQLRQAGLTPLGLR